MKTRSVHAALIALLIGACATTPPGPPTSDPLPRMFPVQFDAAATAPGFEKIDETVSADPFAGKLLRFRSTAYPDLTLSARVFLPGAFVSDQSAIDLVFDRARADLGAEARLLSERRERIDAGLPRAGRSAHFEIRDADGERHLQLATYFVDPYAVLIESSYSMTAVDAYAPLVDAFAHDWLATLRPDPEILCGPPEVVLVRAGLSNVSTNGRVLFLSTETDNVDDQTIGELSRAATQQRGRLGCAADGSDYSAVEAAMRRRSRSR
jgi:hypothetical protein